MMIDDGPRVSVTLMMGGFVAILSALNAYLFIHRRALAVANSSDKAKIAAYVAHLEAIVSAFERGCKIHMAANVNARSRRGRIQARAQGPYHGDRR